MSGMAGRKEEEEAREMALIKVSQIPTPERRKRSGDFFMASKNDIFGKTETFMATFAAAPTCDGYAA